jgi:hypothetical protein
VMPTALSVLLVISFVCLVKCSAYGVDTGLFQLPQIS